MNKLASGIKLYLAPMNKLCNVAFRDLCFKYSCDYVFTEMIRCEQLLDDDLVQLKKLDIPLEAQDRTIVQILCEGEDLNLIDKSVKKISELVPNIQEINYNMGCPQSTLCNNFNGAGILKKPEKIRQVAKILVDACRGVGVMPSIKIRVGLSRDDISLYDNLEMLSSLGIDKVYVHGRVLGEPYSKPAVYEEIAKACELFPDMEIVGNGDVCDSDSYSRMIETGVLGVMIGREGVANPRLFDVLRGKEFGHVVIDGKSFEFEDKKGVVLDFIESCKKHTIRLDQVKLNIAYLTRRVLNGGRFRALVNDCKSLDEIEKVALNY